ncbi:MAG: copper homeostasis protein CutC [Bacteroidaceae bacterium]|nr:copper homeostasis protein CutC [Bacteroidaceae bacterium]
MATKQYLLEVCAGTVEAVRAAHEGGAQRVELCSALSEDGLTPSMGMIRYACRCEGLQVHVLIRPREGDFVYSEAEVECMLADIRLCREMGVDGVVIGALTADGDIDVPVCQRLVDKARGMNITFHRAFDVCRHPFEALEQIVALGCNRLLTSGQAATAEQGIPLLRELVQRAGTRLTIMPGAGVSPENAARLLTETGATELHASARRVLPSGRKETDAAVVRQILARIQP